MAHVRMKGRKVLILCVVIAVAVIALAVRPRPRPVRLTDNTLVELTGLKFGSSNSFIHGNALERLLGSSLPTNGLSLGRFKLNQPRVAASPQFGHPCLSAEFKISGATVNSGQSRMIRPAFYREFRWLITGADGFPYIEEVRQPMRYSDGDFIHIHTTAFPRSSRTLHFQLQEHDDRLGPWRTCAEFERPNPAPDAKLPWTASATPLRWISNDVELVVDTVAITPTYSNRWEYFWQTTLNIPFQVNVNGETKTNWNLHQIQGEDSSGNSLFLGGTKQVAHGWSAYLCFRSMDPGKVWRLKFDLAPESTFAPEEIFTLTVPTPSPGFATNLGPDRVKVGWVNTDMLSVELVDKPEDRRLKFLAAVDHRGNLLRSQGGSWGRSQFWNSLDLRQQTKPSWITATVAITRNIPLQITVQPTLRESSARP